MGTAPSARAWLVQSDGQIHVIQGNCGLGRAQTNQVVLADDRVSRRHASIHAQDEHEYWLVDLGSSNGSYVNGRRVHQPMRLRDGDVLQIGPFRLTFRQPQADGLSLPAADLAERTAVDIRTSACWLVLTDIEGATRLAQELSPEQLAVLVGRWFSRSKQVLERGGAIINKYLGDGLLAYWPATQPALDPLLGALAELQRLQVENSPRFRFVLHHGVVVTGGLASFGEESLSGPEVNFLFRMEKLASGLRQPRLASQAAFELLRERLTLAPLGDHALPGFDGRHPFYAF